MNTWRLVRARRPPVHRAALKIPKIQILREEKCSSVWSYDKNISTFWKNIPLYVFITIQATKTRMKIRNFIYLLKYRGTLLFFSLQKNHQYCTLLFQVQKLIHLSNIRPWKTLLHHLMLESLQIRGYIVKVLLALTVEIHNHILQEKYSMWLILSWVL